ncbi:MAG: HAMP domain-containing sensor histidine kinase [Myxococcales bacterium]
MTAALESVSEPFLVWGPDGRVLAASRRLAGPLGLEPSQLVGSDERAVAAQLSTRGWQGGPHGLLRTDSGQEMQRRVQALPGGARLEVFHDVEADRAGARRREELLGIAIHDLRAPLANVRSYAGLLLSGKLPDLDPRVRRSAEVIARNADRALRLLQMFFDAHRIETGELDIDHVPVDLGPLVQELIAARRGPAAEKGVEIDLLAPPTLPTVVGDRDRMVGAIGSLLDLATARSPAGQHVALSAEQRGRDIVLEVADRGPALTETELRDAFDRDAQALRERRLGAGFACAVAGAIARVHGGDAGVRSTTERTVYWLSLPLDSQAARSP